MVIITHKLKEVSAFADAVTVLRRGRVVGDGPADALTPSDLTALMIGAAQAPGMVERRGAPGAEPCLAVSGLTADGDEGRPGLAIDALAVRPREIVGVAGVSGNGQRELVEVLAGQRAKTGGVVTVSGKPYRARRGESSALGVRIQAGEPLLNGCAPTMSVVDNLNLRRFDRDERGRPRTWLDRGGMAERARALVAAFGVRAPSAEAPIGALSGGNVQRATLARELDGAVELLVAANPCFGLDVKAVAEIRARITAARDAGAAVLLVSEDLDEILEMADRIVVMREGRIVHETPRAGADARAIGGHMVGHA